MIPPLFSETVQMRGADHSVPNEKGWFRAMIIFDLGEIYQLWLQARNSRGSSDAGPKQNWVAV